MNPCFTFNKLRRIIIVFPISAFFNYVFVAMTTNELTEIILFNFCSIDILELNGELLKKLEDSKVSDITSLHCTSTTLN